MSTITEAAFARDIAFMKDPSEWPCWPLLPLTRRGGNLPDDDYCAFLFSEDKRPMIYIGIILFVTVPADGAWKSPLTGFPIKEYASFEELAVDYKVD